MAIDGHRAIGSGSEDARAPAFRPSPTRSLSWPLGLGVYGCRACHRQPGPATVGADILIIDLEDAISPEDKPKALAASIDYLSVAVSPPGPVLIDAVVNRMEMATPPKMTAQMAGGFTLYMLKPVMSGRGYEVVELARSNFFR